MKTVRTNIKARVQPVQPATPALVFPDLIDRPVVVRAEDMRLSSEGGSVLLGQLDRSFGFTQRLVNCFTDQRSADYREHELLTLVRQRVYGLALGYEDLNDHDTLRTDPVLAAICGVRDLEGKARRHPKDRGKPLAGKSTLNRMELQPQRPEDRRYKKIVVNPEPLEDYFIQEYVRSLDRDQRRIVLDLDPTDFKLHGQQEGRFYHGYYQAHCYLPLYIFDGDWPVVARLRTADQEHLADTIRVVTKVVAAIRQRLPKVQIVLRADSKFGRDELMNWCEAHDVQYLFGLGCNAVLWRRLRGAFAEARSMLAFNESEQERVYRDFDYRAKKWKKYRRRRVVGKATVTADKLKARFIITNMARTAVAGPALYEEHYCARGEMENRLKEQKGDLRADRMSSRQLAANQLRLWFTTLAYLLMNKLRRWGLAGTELAQATCGTIRLKLLKVGAVVRTRRRQLQIALSAHCPLKHLWFTVGNRLLVGGSS